MVDPMAFTELTELIVLLALLGAVRRSPDLGAAALLVCLVTVR
jgi:hypothetical protein